jgi:hypothetical protein
MTVDSAYFIQPIANDGDVEFTFEMESIGAEALEVYSVADTVYTLMADTEYSVTFGYRDPINYRGTVTLNAVLPEGTSLQIQRNTPITNEQVFPAGKPFQSEAWEYAIDKLTFIMQELEGTLCDCRAAKTTPGYTPDPSDPTDGSGPTGTCQIFDDYIRNIANIFSYGIFGDNKGNAEAWNYDETGNGNTWALAVDASSAARWEGQSLVTCQNDLNYIYNFGTGYGDILVVISPDVAKPAGWVTSGAISVASAEPAIVNNSLAGIKRYRQSADMYIGYDADRKVYVDVNNFGGNRQYFSPELFIEVDEFVFASLAYNSATNAFYARVDDHVFSGAFASAPTGQWDAGAEVKTGLTAAVGTSNAWAVDGYDDGAEAYAAYLQSIGA